LIILFIHAAMILLKYVKTEFEMKLHIESLEGKFEYYNQIKKENKYLHEKIKKMEDTKKDNEIIILRTENKNMKDILSNKEMEFGLKEKEYLAQISELTNKLVYFEDTLKIQNSRILMESENDKSVSFYFNELIKENIYLTTTTTKPFFLI